jgi:hypothetical protein
MWYLLKVDALIGAFVFSIAGFFILAMFAWHEAKAYAAARHRIYRRLATLVTEPQFFANSFAISRSFSRVGGHSHAASHKVQ